MQHHQKVILCLFVLTAVFGQIIGELSADIRVAHDLLELSYDTAVRLRTQLEDFSVPIFSGSVYREDIYERLVRLRVSEEQLGELSSLHANYSTDIKQVLLSEPSKIGAAYYAPLTTTQRDLKSAELNATALAWDMDNILTKSINYVNQHFPVIYAEIYVRITHLADRVKDLIDEQSSNPHYDAILQDIEAITSPIHAYHRITERCIDDLSLYVDLALQAVDQVLSQLPPLIASSVQ